MVKSKKVVVVMPAYNAAQTLKNTYEELPLDIVDEVVLVDDCSSDGTAHLAKSLGIQHVVVHKTNKGYGGNQKSCYAKALELGADIVIMIHPDYQYTPALCGAIAHLIGSGTYHCVLASRILGTGAISGGMPLYKYVANRFLTFFQNILLPYKLTEYHSGYRAFSKPLLESLPLEENSDDFIFDNQMLVQVIAAKYDIAEVTCPTKYFTDASSINFVRSVKYGLGVIATTLHYKLWQVKILRVPRFEKIKKYESL